MSEDTDQLRRYAEEGDQEAFAAVVRRHIDLVYSVALRQLNGDVHLATDATQLVFTDLARKSRALASHQVLAGWLFTSTRFVTAKLVRGERRRQAREQAALRMEAFMRNDAPDADWDRLRPVLDDALAELAHLDREALILRFFEGRDYRTVGARLALSENAARMRVERALDKLRARLVRRGVESSAALLAVALAGPAMPAAPVGLAAAVAGKALSGGASAAGWAAWTHFMHLGNLHVGVSGALLVGAAAGWVVESHDHAALRAELVELRASGDDLAGLERENRRLADVLGEAGELRRDDAEFTRLQEEASLLQRRLTTLVRAAEEKARAAQAAAALYSLNELDQAPVARFQARPQYPAELRAAGIEGSVVVEFVVGTEGDVEHARAVRSTHPALESAAAEAVTRWKFKAGRKDGRDVRTRLQIPIVFTVADRSRPPAAGSSNAESAPTSPPFTVQYSGSGAPSPRP